MDNVPSPPVCEEEGPLLRFLREVLHELPFLSSGKSRLRELERRVLLARSFSCQLECSTVLNRSSTIWYAPCRDTGCAGALPVPVAEAVPARVQAAQVQAGEGEQEETGLRKSGSAQLSSAATCCCHVKR